MLIQHHAIVDTYELKQQRTFMVPPTKYKLFISVDLAACISPINVERIPGQPGHLRGANAC
jgi:hypothetical protein